MGGKNTKPKPASLWPHAFSVPRAMHWFADAGFIITCPLCGKPLNEIARDVSCRHIWHCVNRILSQYGEEPITDVHYEYVNYYPLATAVACIVCEFTHKFYDYHNLNGCIFGVILIKNEPFVGPTELPGPVELSYDKLMLLADGCCPVEGCPAKSRGMHATTWHYLFQHQWSRNSLAERFRFAQKSANSTTQLVLCKPDAAPTNATAMIDYSCLEALVKEYFANKHAPCPLCGRTVRGDRAGHLSRDCLMYRGRLSTEANFPTAIYLKCWLSNSVVHWRGATWRVGTPPPTAIGHGLWYWDGGQWTCDSDWTFEDMWLRAMQFDDEPEEALYWCPHCGNPFWSRDSLANHLLLSLPALHNEGVRRNLVAAKQLLRRHAESGNVVFRRVHNQARPSFFR